MGGYRGSRGHFRGPVDTRVGVLSPQDLCDTGRSLSGAYPAFLGKAQERSAKKGWEVLRQL